MNGRNLARAAAIVTTIAGAAAGLFLGCGGGGGGKMLTEADFCAQKADAECVVTDKCLTDKTACTTQRLAMCMAFVTDAKRSGMRNFVASNIGDCINKTKAAYAKPTITPADMATMNDACNYVFQGKGMVNLDHCDVKYDCAGKVICDKTFCANASSPKASGQPCNNPGDICATGNYCAMNMAGVNVCTARGMSGATCDQFTPCLENLRCAAGSCADRVALAGACTTNDDCATAAPYCDPYAGNKCDQGLSFSSSGGGACVDYGGSGTPAGTGGSGGGAGGSGGTGGSSGGSGGGGGGTGGTGGNQDAGAD
jgi:hypothetical protein